MKKNMGAADKAIRMVIATIIAALYFGNVIGGTMAAVLLVVAVVLGVTAFAGTCPLYSLFGINTCKRKADV